jgi:hypothetical protein
MIVQRLMLNKSVIHSYYLINCVNLSLYVAASWNNSIIFRRNIILLILPQSVSVFVVRVYICADIIIKERNIVYFLDARYVWQAISKSILEAMNDRYKAPLFLAKGRNCHPEKLIHIFSTDNIYAKVCRVLNCMNGASSYLHNI